jgi:hypothetical protein
MPNCTFGVENLSPVPNEGRVGLERLAKEINEREKQKFEAQKKAKEDMAKQAAGY